MPRQARVRIGDSAQRAALGSAKPWIAGADLRPLVRREPRLHGARARADRTPAAGKEGRMTDDQADSKPESRGPARRGLGRGLGALLGEARREEPLVRPAREADDESVLPARRTDGLAN